MRILKENTIALIIDIQERLWPHIADNEILEKNIGVLASGLGILEIPVLVTEQYTKGLGFTIPSLKSKLHEKFYVEKTAFSCCDEPHLIKKLNESGKKDVLIAGVEAHVCVLQTVTDLLAKGYQPVVIEDCVSSRKLNDKRIAIQRMQSEGAIISTCESILFELTRISGTEQFKSISKLLK